MKTSKEAVRVSSSVDTVTETVEKRLSKTALFMLNKKEKGTIVNMRAVLR
ncbi:hypothetical protein AGMMS49965_01640 [Bacteroidia bacterium]|nr:hypothetical protein AGMMS49965_01640 [Bacteroidia bacterium]